MQKYEHLHWVAWRHNLEIYHVYIKEDKILWLFICFSVYNFEIDGAQKVVEFPLQSNLSHSTSNETIGGLFTKHPVHKN